MTYYLYNYINTISILIEHTDWVVALSKSRFIEEYNIDNTLVTIIKFPNHLTSNGLFKTTSKNVIINKELHNNTIFVTDNLLDFYNYVISIQTIELL